MTHEATTARFLVSESCPWKTLPPNCEVRPMEEELISGVGRSCLVYMQVETLRATEEPPLADKVVTARQSSEEGSYDPPSWRID